MRASFFHVLGLVLLLGLIFGDVSAQQFDEFDIYVKCLQEYPVSKWDSPEWQLVFIFACTVIAIAVLLIFYSFIWCLQKCTDPSYSSPPQTWHPPPPLNHCPPNNHWQNQPQNWSQGFNQSQARTRPPVRVPGAANQRHVKSNTYLRRSRP